MIKKIVMPAAGQTTDAATVGCINVKVGDKVSRGDELMDVETDKATLPIESIANGFVIRIHVEEYDKIDAGTLLMEIGSEEDLKAALEAPAEEQKEPEEEKPEEKAEPVKEEKKAEPSPAGDALKKFDAIASAIIGAESKDGKVSEKDLNEIAGIRAGLEKAMQKAEAIKAALVTPFAKAEPAPAVEVKAMPSARKAAAELGVNLASVKPENGQFIKKSDVEKFAGANAGAAAAFATPVATSFMRDTLSAKLEKTCVVSQSVMKECGADAVLHVCSAIGATAGDLIMLALSKLADRFPLLCARNEKNKLVKSDTCAFGLAFTGINGTVSAAVSGIEDMKLKDLAALNRKNAAAIASGDMSSVGPVSLTVYDLSAGRADSFAPSVQTPELVSVSCGGIKLRPYVKEDGSLGVRNSFVLSLSYDARAIDAPVAAELLSQLCELMEEPGLMV